MAFLVILKFTPVYSNLFSTNLTLPFFYKNKLIHSMTDKLTISTLQLAEIDSLVSLINSAYRGESSRQGWTTEADLLGGIRTDPSAIKAIIDAPDSAIMVCYTETKRMAGCVYLRMDETELYLGMLTVAPDIQAKGIGKTLLAWSEDYARKNGFKKIVMTVIEKRIELIAWYVRHGYQSTGEIKPFPNDPAFGIPKEPLQFIVLEKNV
ncbi:GNAT family N-acetyltransferase [soil metagenome]